MFNFEHTSLMKDCIVLSAQITLEELSTYLQRQQAVMIEASGAVHLFIPEDNELLALMAAANVQSLIESSTYFMSPDLLVETDTAGKPLADTLLALEALMKRSKQLLATGRPLLVRNASGQYRGYIPIAACLQAALLESERWSAYFNSLADTVTDAVTVVDRSGEVICWNTAAEELYALPRSEAVGKRIGEHFETETLLVLPMLDEGRTIRNTYHRPRPDTHVLINAAPIRDRDGRIIGGIAAEQDITQLVRLNEQLTSVGTSSLPPQEGANDLFAQIQGNGPAIGKVVQWAKKVAATETPVLLIGESGVGKEQLAHIIHRSGPRSEQPFLTLNCGIVPAALLDAELFGYQGGAFSGSSNGQPGKLELASEGTLLINEIEKLPMELQARLFQYMTEQIFVRTGGSQPVHVRTRILFATAQDLAGLTQKQQFRADLYYTLSVISIRIPPLRDRTEDIPAMVQIYLKQLSAQYHKPVPRLTPEVMLAFSQYSWPGNIQELRSVMERCIILSDDDTITLDQLPPALQEEIHSLASWETEAPYSLTGKAKPSGQSEVGMIEDALARTAGNKSAAAKLLGVSRGTLYNKMREYRLE